MIYLYIIYFYINLSFILYNLSYILFSFFLNKGSGIMFFSKMANLLENQIFVKK